VMRCSAKTGTTTAVPVPGCNVVGTVGLFLRAGFGLAMGFFAGAFRVADFLFAAEFFEGDFLGDTIEAPLLHRIH
jgi:hypothetical protein